MSPARNDRIQFWGAVTWLVAGMAAIAPRSILASGGRSSQLELRERIFAQRRIEHVYYERRLWPKENPQPKPPFEAMVPAAVIERSARESIQKSNVLKQRWGIDVTPAMLQAEMDRMARDTKNPTMLGELFAALNHDPTLIAETLARDHLSDTLIHAAYVNDPGLHQEVRQRAEAIRNASAALDWRLLAHGEGPYYSSKEFTQNMSVSPDSWHEALRIDAEIIPAGIAAWRQDYPKGDGAVALVETPEGYWLKRTLKPSPQRLLFESLFMPKRSFDDWWRNISLKIDYTATNDIRAVSQTFQLPVIVNTAVCDQWSATSTVNAPPRRGSPGAVWTGAEMIIWGGDKADSYIGGKYDPATDSWTPTSTGANVPAARYDLSAVWTGKEMIVWGGVAYFSYNSGGRYDPVLNSWSPTSLTNAPSARRSHTAVWTGNEMIIWGGDDCGSTCTIYNDGGKYLPQSDIWTTLAGGVNVPEARSSHSAVWNGSVMVIWGGSTSDGSTSIRFNSGGRYNNNSDGWLPTSVAGAVPEPRAGHQAVWTGTEMLIWGGLAIIGSTNYPLSSGGRYSPSSDQWQTTSTSASSPSARTYHTAIWTGIEMISWGGYDPTTMPAPTPYNTGGRYYPNSDTWQPTSITGAVPFPRIWHSAVWTGNQMIVWGGWGTTNGTNTGGVYTTGEAPSPGNTLRGNKSSSVNLTWSWITGAGSYNVKRCDATTSPCTPTTIVSTPTINQYSEPNDALSHFYAIESVNQCGATP